MRLGMYEKGPQCRQVGWIREKGRTAQVRGIQEL